MAVSSGEVYLPGVKAENDLSAKQHYLVEGGTNAQEVDVCDNAADLVVGVLCNEPTAGKAAQVQYMGVAKVIAGGTISAWARVGTDASGKAVAKTADTDLTCGIALESAVLNDIFSVLLCIGTQRAA